MTILWCRSSQTGKEFPIVQFSGDTDMATDGLVSLTSTSKPEVFVTTVTAEEYNADKKGTLKCEERVNRELSRIDLRVNFHVRIESASPPTGTSFQEFRKLFKPPMLFYRDIFSESGEAAVVKEETVDSFRSSGGVLHVLSGV